MSSFFVSLFVRKTQGMTTQKLAIITAKIPALAINTERNNGNRSIYDDNIEWLYGGFGLNGIVSVARQWQ